MKLKNHEIQPVEKNAFANCKLGREKYAKSLTQLVKNTTDGFVLAIDNEWGAGKTSFIKMWKQSLDDQKFRTLYFNAWENDFESQPLVAILSELKSLFGNDKVKFKKVLKHAGKFSKAIIPVVAEAVAARFIDSKTLVEAFKELSKEGADLLETEITQYAEKKKDLEAFKKELTDLIAAHTGPKPVVFFVDELDRCKPDYAVEVLEHIKHFFSVEGIVFVLSINKSQLKESIKGYYGSQNFDADDYLKRFIDIEYRLPEPDRVAFVDYLWQVFDFDAFFKTNRRYNLLGNREIIDLREAYNALLKNSNLTLRSIEKLVGLFKAGLMFSNNEELLYPDLLFYHSYMKIFKNDIFDKIQNKVFSVQGFVDATEKFCYDLFQNPDDTHNDVKTKIFCKSIKSYSEYLPINRRLNSLIRKGYNGPEIAFELKLYDKQKVFGCISNIQHISDFGFFADKLNFTVIMNEIIEEE